MAAVASSFSSHHFDRLDMSQGSRLTMDHPMGPVQLVPNPDFVFPARSAQGSDAPSLQRRPVTMHLDLSAPQSRPRGQGKSVSTLPTFTFNATSTSGMGPASPPLESPTSTVPVTPSRNLGHRRRASEFVGGDSRFGVSTLVSTSPLRLPDTLSIPGDSSATGSPGRRKGHAHRRSAAISGHDLASILQPRDVNIATQTSPNLATKENARIPTPAFTFGETRSEEVKLPTVPVSCPPTSDSDSSPARPPSRPRVGFSENVEYIPRPLSTVSSDTASSASTIRGHSVSNSVSSMISLGGIGTPSPRRTRTPPTMDMRSTVVPTDRSAFEFRPTLDQSEDEWATPGKAPTTDSAATSPNFSITLDEPETPRLSKKKGFLRLDRRRSEPLISAGALEPSPGLSTVSLQEPIMSESFQAKSNECDAGYYDLNRKSSRRKVKAWATSLLGRKARDPRKTQSMFIPADAVDASEFDMTASQPEESTAPEPDLDALFGQDPFSTSGDFPSFSFPRDLGDQSSYPSFTSGEQFEDRSSMIDLDAALGPHGTPTMSGGRRQMHSGGFGRRGADRGHNRTYSLPTLAPFEFDRNSSPVRSSMADVFEEDEEADTAVPGDAPSSESPAAEAVDSDDEEGTGIQIVDAVAEHEDPIPARNVDQGLGIHNRSMGSSLPLPKSPTGMRRTSVVEDTIIEESSPIEIVEDYEEPRTSSVTKSSDSSEASTVLADRSNMALSVPSAEPSPLTPAFHAGPMFSSPGYHSQPNLFDHARLGTSNSSIGDNRTISSFATGEHGLDRRVSIEEVPSLTSSRSTMISAMQPSGPRRDFSDRSGSVMSIPVETEVMERRRKRSSIQSLSTLLGGSFGETRNRSSSYQRPQTAVCESTHQDGKKRKENRLSKLMFWRSKSERSERSVSSTK